MQTVSPVIGRGRRPRRVGEKSCPGIVEPRSIPNANEAPARGALSTTATEADTRSPDNRGGLWGHEGEAGESCAAGS
jgi:hypothetical protein